MSRLRHSSTALAVLALVVAAPVLVAAPAAAQDDPPPPEFFIFSNVMTNPTTDANRDGVPDTRWQVQVTANALNNCVPKRGSVSYVSTWVDAGEEVGASLSTLECVFRIAAKVRVAANPGCTYRAELSWAGRDGTPVGDYQDDSVMTSSRPDDERNLLIRRDADSGCASPNRTYFVLGGAGIVEELPGASDADRDLIALARQSVGVGQYTVRVEPTGARVAPGCDIATTFTLRGDRSTSPQELGATGAKCPSRASVATAPAHVKVPAGRYVTFDAALPNIIVDLTSLIRIEAARIAIVQDVAGSANVGAVSYLIDRSCGGVSFPSPAAQVASTTLFQGRFTVHSPDAPQFGPVGMYTAVASTADSRSLAACAVTVTLSGLPAGCTVAGGNTQRLAWTAAAPFDHFDFEFDIGCGGAAPPTSGVPPAPPAGDPAPPADDPSPATPDDGAAEVESGSDTLRIVARRLANGKIQFGLQQRGHDGSWGERAFPTARLFPTTATVGRWLHSSSMNLHVAEAADSSDEQVRVRIVARRLADGRVEFGLQSHDGSWGERTLPTRRYFPTTARVDRWLHSSVLVVDN